MAYTMGFGCMWGSGCLRTKPNTQQHPTYTHNPLKKNCFVFWVTPCFPDVCWFFISAKATYAAISKTYSYLTPDLWKETVFTKSPYQEFTDFLMKNHSRVAVQRQEQKIY